MDYLDDTVFDEEVETSDLITELEEHVRLSRQESIENAKRNFQELSFQEAITQYRIVGASSDPTHPYVILADPSENADLTLRELGYASPSPWTSWTRTERVPELMGQRGLRTYYDMKRADGTVRGALRLLKTPILAARWFVEPATDSTIDKNIAEFVEKNLFEDLSVPWTRVVEDALLMCEYGFMPFELVWNDNLDKNGKRTIQKLGPRHPMDIRQWVWDDNGGINGIIMEPAQRMQFQGIFQGIDYATGMDNPIPVYIPIEKLVIFVLEQEAGDLRGISILRSAYKHYFYKDTLYKIDAIQKERHGIGIPIIKLPPGFSDTDRKLADELGRNLRTNERAHIVVPSNWDIAFAEISSQPVDCLRTIDHHDMKIKSNILAPFMDEANVRPDSMDVYFKSTRYIANTVCDTFNHFVIPKLVEANFARGGNPKLRVRRIGEQEDIRTMSFSFRNFVGAGAIRPDDELEKFLRTELDLPPMDKSTIRVISTPQLAVGPGAQEALKGGVDQAKVKNVVDASIGPPRVAPPRQSTSPPVGTGGANSGRDTSGGKK